LFCRVFLVSCDILNPGSGYAKHRILFKQVFGILLQQCHGNWNHPCNTRGPFSGNVFFLPSFLDLWSKIVPVSHPFSLFFLKFVDLFNKCLESKSCYLTSNRYSQNLLFFPLYAFLCVICLFSLVKSVSWLKVHSKWIGLKSMKRSNWISSTTWFSVWFSEFCEPVLHIIGIRLLMKELNFLTGNEASADRSKELACNFYILITCVYQLSHLTFRFLFTIERRFIFILSSFLFRLAWELFYFATCQDCCIQYSWRWG
jgi:hypothetical protein